MSKLFYKIIERALHFANSRGSQTSFFSVNRYVATNRLSQLHDTAVSGRHDDVGIIIQGPITKYTLVSVRHYADVFPSAKIIISTWEDSNDLLLLQAENLGAVIVTTRKPPIAGYLNFNFQVASTREGIAVAERFNLRYLVKTRSDQRINSPNAITFLKSLLHAFPVGDLVHSNDRMVFCSTETLAAVPLHVCDMFQFGSVTDIKRLWDLPMMTCSVSREEHDAKISSVGSEVDYLKAAKLVPEIYLGNHLANSFLDRASSMTDAQKYSKLLKCFLVLVDKEMIQLSWPKYHAHGQLLDYNLPAGFQKITFEKWLCELNNE